MICKSALMDFLVSQGRGSQGTDTQCGGPNDKEGLAPRRAGVEVGDQPPHLLTPGTLEE